MKTPLLSVTLLVAGCAQGAVPGGPVPGVDAPPGGPPPDAAPGVDIDAPPVVDIDAPPPMPAGAAALLLTEVVLAPTAGEFVEITNPTAQTVDLSTYYLSDSGQYFRLPAGAPTMDANDFIVKFPAGAMIAPGATITVAIDTAANFTTTYGIAPTFSIASGTMTGIAASGAATLTNGGEPIVLFQWNGQADLVRDVDIVLAGVPSAANLLADKSGVAIDGPDADTTPSTYATDARTIPAQAAAPASGKSTKRVRFPAGHQLATGTGNGLDGTDETSENTAATWDTAFTNPTPGALPSGGLVP
ncbi:MAG: lamin tail domain-containing protein [Deltaproteobacteria bacterium]|nr:lamin tail domain-containing protein [Deltaproteobacteria bacterium]